jgi:hypothetical protein
MAKLVRVGSRVLNLDAVAYIEPGALPGTFRVYLLGPENDGLAYLDVDSGDLTEILTAAGLGSK